MSIPRSFRAHSVTRAVLLTQLALFVAVTAAPSVASQALDGRDAGLTAQSVLRAYQERDLDQLAALSTPRNQQILRDLARQGEAHPRFASLFAGWRWTAVERWRGDVGAARYTYADDPDGTRMARVPFAIDGDRIAVVTLVWSFGRWTFDDIHRVREDLLIRGAANPPPPPNSVIGAARDGYLDVVRRLLVDAPENLESRDTEGRTPLLLATMGRHRAVIELLVAAGADVNASAVDGRTPLMLASGLGSDEIVRLLLAQGADTDLVTERGDTALALAARAGSGELVRMLLDAGAGPAEASARRALVETAARANNAAGLGALVEGGMPVGANVLMAAITGGAPDTSRALIEMGLNVNRRSSAGWTPLMTAAVSTSGGQSAIVSMLLAAGADIDASDARGTTALAAAATSGGVAAAQVLVDAGADLVPGWLWSWPPSRGTTAWCNFS